MSKVDELLAGIARVTKAEDHDLTELIKEFPSVGYLVKRVSTYEKGIAKLLRSQLKKLKKNAELVTLADLPVAVVLDLLFDKDDFETLMATQSKTFLSATVSKLTSDIMSAIDKQVPMDILSGRTLTWIDEWSPKLANLMNLSTHTAVQSAIEKTLTEGGDIASLVRDLQALPEFTRKRARATAITETLTASSVAAQESYSQSPAVTGKKWLHTSGKGISPRPAHVALSETTVGVDETFDVNGFNALYPRDVALPASERVHCHCVLSPVVDQKILGLSAEEKKAIRDDVLAEMT